MDRTVEKAGGDTGSLPRFIRVPSAGSHGRDGHAARGGTAPRIASFHTGKKSRLE